jgi:hypothetical protein
MICPLCKAEYRRGFTRCADCDVDLAYELPSQAARNVEVAEEPAAVVEGEEVKALQRWADSVGCADACLKLRDAGIAYRVTELPRVLGLRMEPRQEFEIAVPVVLFEKAKEVLRIQIELGEEENLPSDEEIQAVMELPDHGDLSAGEDVKPNWDPENWHEEDATVEVWSSEQLRPGDTIELSLRENQVHARFNRRRGQYAIFVMPEDESRAQEIVREIVEGAPPE